MKNLTITISDLPVTEDLDKQAMAEISGGTKTYSQAIGELVQFVSDFLAGKCEKSSTGKSWVCY